MTERRKLFGKTASEATKDKPVAREAGRIAGSALIGGAAGLGVKGIAENLDKGRKRTIKFLEKKKKKDLEKAIKKIDDIATIGKVKDSTVKSSKELAKSLTEDKIKDVRKLSKKLKKVTKPVSKFAQTKGGKAALIGIPTAVVGGVVYKSSKKKDKKK